MPRHNRRGGAMPRRSLLGTVWGVDLRRSTSTTGPGWLPVAGLSTKDQRAQSISIKPVIVMAIALGTAALPAPTREGGRPAGPAPDPLRRLMAAPPRL